MFRIFLFIHVLSAIVAFGPNFSIPIMAAWIQKNDPGGTEFLLKMGNVLGRRQIGPASALLLLSGIGLILTTNRPITQPWLAGGIVLYLIAMGLGIFVQTPSSNRMIRIAKGDLEGLNIPPDGAFQALMQEVKRSRVVGTILMVLFLIILALMIWKPGI
jgi:uncharacterized membrane protein